MILKQIQNNPADRNAFTCRKQTSIVDCSKSTINKQQVRNRNTANQLVNDKVSYVLYNTQNNLYIKHYTLTLYE